MRNIFLSIILVGLYSLSMIASARDMEQGTLELNGGLDLSISSVKMEPETGSNVDIDTKTLSVGVLYYVVQNFGLGLTWDYSSTNVKINGLKAESKTNQVGPVASLNISTNEDLSLRIMGAFLLASTGDGLGGDVDGFGWGISGGLSYFINDGVSINGILQYVYLKLEHDDTGVDLDSNGFGAGVGLSVYLF